MKTLYHVSKKYLGEECFFNPKIPKRTMKEEDNEIERICFSETIVGACSGISGTKNFKCIVSDSYQQILDKNKRLKIVHPSLYTIATNNYYRPTKKEVPDVDVTLERWFLMPISLQFIGFLDFKKLIEDFDHFYKNEVTILSRNNFTYLSSLENNLISEKNTSIFNYDKLNSFLNLIEKFDEYEVEFGKLIFKSKSC